MSFSILLATGEADQVKAEVGYAAGHDRESEVIAVVKSSVEALAQTVGGYVAISANGHVGEVEGPGDSINIQVNSILRPEPVAEDAGLEAIGGSARNYPPESVTAAPPNADDSTAPVLVEISQPLSPEEYAEAYPEELAKDDASEEVAEQSEEHGESESAAQQDQSDAA